MIHHPEYVSHQLRNLELPKKERKILHITIYFNMLASRENIKHTNESIKKYDKVPIHGSKASALPS